MDLNTSFRQNGLCLLANEFSALEDINDWLKGFPPEEPIVAIPVYNAFEDASICIKIILERTDNTVPIIVIDDASTDPRIFDDIGQNALNSKYLYIRNNINSGFVGSANLAFSFSTTRDIILVNSDVLVPNNWLRRLQNAAYYRDIIATATAWTNDGTILSVPFWNKPIHILPRDMSLEEIDSCIEKSSLRIRPIIPTAVGHCTYFKRLILNRIGFFDVAFKPGYGEEVDFSQRAISAGFCHVVADDLFVYHYGGKSFSAKGTDLRQSIRKEHEQIIAERYPWYHLWILETQQDISSPLFRAHKQANMSLLARNIAIDLTYFDGTPNGTHIVATELLQSLIKNRPDNYNITIITANDQALNLFRSEFKDINILPFEDIRKLDRKFDLVHRPSQVRSINDIKFIQHIGDKNIISYLDIIAFSNPSYADNADIWIDYRSATKRAFNEADGIIFNSHSVIHDAIHQGLIIEEERRCVSLNGVDHIRHVDHKYHPDNLFLFAEEEFMLVVGTNFKHKNRIFSLQVFKCLVDKYDWNGHLVFIGPNVSGDGGSNIEEWSFLNENPKLQARFHNLGSIPEDQKQWLIQKARLVLYPSTYEGFGLVPFEAAALGTPTLTSRLTSLSEVLGEKPAYLETFNPAQESELVWRLLTDEKMRKQQLFYIQEQSQKYTWEQVAIVTWSFYEHILSLPKRTTIETEPLRSSAVEHIIESMVNYTSAKPRGRISLWIDRIARMVLLWNNNGFIAVQERFLKYLKRRRARRFFSK